jgi:K+-transporting ATPase ATPase C chain
MYNLSRELWTAVRFTGVAIVGCGVLYPLVAVGLGALLFPDQAVGSVLEVDGRAVGSRMVGQPFVSERYLQGRPSSCGHDPRALAGSNLAPSSVDLRTRAATEAARLAAQEGVRADQIAVELIAASGSCIDPDVTMEAAAVQLPRIARSRGVSLAAVQAVVQDQAVGGGPWSLGPARVNVLEVNLALDRMPADHAR